MINQLRRYSHVRTLTKVVMAAMLLGSLAAISGISFTAASAATASPCSADTVTAPAEVTSGVPIVVNATSTCPTGASPLYSYFMSTPTGAWQLRAAWVGGSWTLSTAGMPNGTYQVLAWVSDGPSFAAPQAESAATVTVAPQPLCTGASSTTTADSGLASAGATIEVSPTCSGAAEYAYFSGPVGGPYTLDEGWTADPDFTYTTTNWQPGSYNLIAWVSDEANSAPDTSATSVYQVLADSTCTAVSISATPASTAPGANVTLVASGSCGGATANYSFFKGPTANGPWTLVEAWNGPDYVFNTAGLAPGNYYFVAWATDLASLVPQVQTVFEYTVSPMTACSAITGSASANSDQGVPVTLTANATCGGTAYFAYFWGPTSGPNTLDEGWTTSNVYTFNTSSWQPGTYNLFAWVTDGALSTPQLQAVVSYTVTTPPPCTGGTASTNVAADVVGDPVTLNIVADCPASPTYYVYWMAPVGGGWNLEEGWTTSSSFTYDTEGWAAGDYNLMAWISTENGTPQLQVEDSSFSIAGDGAFFVGGITTYDSQIYSMDCEEAALQMALEHENISTTQPSILSLEGVNTAVAGIGPNSGDPNADFVGPPNGTEGATWEPGTYSPVIARVATDLGATVLAQGQGITPQELYTDVESNHSVVAWVTFNFQHYNEATYCNASGCYPWDGPHGHVVTIVGIGANAVLIDNPWPSPTFGGEYTGQNVWVPMSVFEAAYSSYGDMAVVLS